MQSEYARLYRDLYQRHWWWRAREALLLQTLRNLHEEGPPLRLLDVGCGSGLFFDRLSEFGEVAGVEADPTLARADPRFSPKIQIGDFASVRPPGTYDWVLMLDVLEHMRNPEQALRNAFAVVESSGRVVVTVPAFPLLWTSHDVINRHVTRYTRGSLRGLVEQAGGRVDRLQYFFHWLFPGKLAVRLIESLRGPSGPEQVPPPFVNRCLYWLSRVEQSLLGGVRLPFGTSLLAICSKNLAQQ
jgi:SAM-dependent methyltransferase